MNSRCFICSKTGADRGDYHSSCLKSFFGSGSVPEIPFGLNDLDKLGAELINSRVTIPGVQKKLSLHFSEESESARLTFVGVMGDYILKPPVEAYPELPENEHLTMTLAEILGIRTVPHGLIRMKSGEPAYITKRIDRRKTGKIHMEDGCQLTGRMTEDKYRGSIEQVGKIVAKYCDNRMFDILRLFEIVLFSYLTGNSDMHLKNFSLIENRSGFELAPAYDLINTRLAISEKEDPDETALSLNGKRRKLQFNDFFQLGINLTLSEKQIENVFKRFINAESMFIEKIYNSFLSKDMQNKYVEILARRFKILSESY